MQKINNMAVFSKKYLVTPSTSSQINLLLFVVHLLPLHTRHLMSVIFTARCDSKIDVYIEKLRNKQKWWQHLIKQ